MEFVGKVFTTVSEFYNDINPATLSGAIDVVVVEQPDGSLHCSPFHVRFGKMHLLRPQEKVVEFKVNGKIVDFPMKVGEAGEAFFVMETMKPVPFELETSPLAGPSKPTGEMEAVEALDLGDTSFMSPSQESNAINPFAEPTTQLQPVTVSVDPSSSTSSNENNGYFAGDNAEDYGNIGQVSLGQKAERQSSLESVQTADTSASAGHDQSVFALTEVKGETSAFHSPTLAAEISELSLAMPSSQEINNAFAKTAIISSQTSPLSLVSNNQTSPVEVTYPLSDTEFELASSPKPTHWNIPLSDANAVGPLSDTELDYATEGTSKRNSLSAINLNSLSLKNNEPNPAVQNPLQYIINTKKLPEVEDYSALLDGWEISLCGPKLTKSDAKETFDKYLVSSESFHRTPSMTADPNLIFRFNENYYTWEFVAPVILSCLLFKQPIPAGSLSTLLTNAHKKHASNLPSNDNQIASAAYALTGTWKNWWSRNLAGSTASSISPPEPANSVKSNLDGSPTSKALAAERQMQRSSSAPTQPNNALYRLPKRYTKTLRLTSDQLKSLDLKYGPNEVSFTVNTNFSGTASCKARIFLWRHNVQIVVSDIDGTITKSDALGHLFSMVGKDWTHPGIANLYTNIKRNGYEFLYLTSRAIGQADWTRLYLRGVEQGSYNLPDGPVIMSPDRLIAALKREVIDRRPEEFKIAALTDIRNLFGGRNPFYAGFGNRITDALSYRAVDIPAYRIYSIDPKGQVKMDFFYGYSSSYVKLTDLADHIFPHIKLDDEPINNGVVETAGQSLAALRRTNSDSSSTTSNNNPSVVHFNRTITDPRNLPLTVPHHEPPILEEEREPLIDRLSQNAVANRLISRNAAASSASIATTISSSGRETKEAYNDYHYWRNIPEIPDDELLLEDYDEYEGDEYSSSEYYDNEEEFEEEESPIEGNPVDELIGKELHSESSENEQSQQSSVAPSASATTKSNHFTYQAL